jgi:ubiquinone/menaquinone biosynthesis C-methylase UbiE
MVDDVARWNFIHQKTHKKESTQSRYAEEKEKLFPKGCLVCELGGGAGYDALYFLKQGHSVVLFDISDLALSIAQEKAKEAGLESRLATRHIDFGLHDLPVKDESTDIVYSRIALHYFESSHTIKIFKDIHRILKPGGTAFLTFKSPKDVAEYDRLKKTATLYEPNVFIENGLIRSRYTIEQLEDMLKKAGISHYDVHDYQENLTSEGQQGQILLLNEVVITK